MKHQPKYNIGENVIVLDVSGAFKEAEIKGHMLIQRGENLNYKAELVYIITEVSANIDEMYTDVRLKLYHEDCVYKDRKDLAERGVPIKPSQRPGFEKFPKDPDKK